MRIQPTPSPTLVGTRQPLTDPAQRKTSAVGSPDIPTRGALPAGATEAAPRPRSLAARILQTLCMQSAEAPAAPALDACAARGREAVDQVLSLEQRALALAPQEEPGASVDAGLQLRRAQQSAGLLQVACAEAQGLEARLTRLLSEASKRAEAPDRQAQLRESAGAMNVAQAAAPQGSRAPVAAEPVARRTTLNSRLDPLVREAPGSAVHQSPKDSLRQALEVTGRVQGSLQALATQAQAGVRAAQVEANRQHGQQVRQIAAHPPGFAAAPALGDALLAQTQGLPGPNDTGTLTRLDVLQLAVPALSVVTGGDEARAQAALKELGSRPLHDWVPPRGADATPANAADRDVRTLMHLMNHLPRGLEALSLMAGHDGPPPSAARLDIIGTYLKAEEALPQARPQEQARLAGAMAVAQYKLHPDPAARPTPAERAAYTAVRSGLHTSERFDQANQRLEQAFTAWIEDGAKAPHWLPPLHIRHNLTPFEGKTLDLGAQAATETGLCTGAAEASEKVRAVAGQLLAQVPAGPDAREQGLRAVLSHLKERETAGVAGVTLTASDINAIATRLTDATRAATRPGSPDSQVARLAEGLADLRDKAAEVAQDARDGMGTGAHLQAHGPWLDHLARPGDTPGQVLERVLAEMAAKGTRGLEPIQQTLQQARRAEQSAGVHQIRSGEDLSRLLAPTLDHLEQGDTLELKGGADTGVSLPYVPLGVVGPVRLTLAGAYHHERNTSLAIRRDPTGILISVGHADLRKGEARLTAGGQIGTDPAGAAVTAGVHKVRSQQDTDALILRVPDRGDELALHQEASALLRDLTAWRQQASAQAPGAARKDLLSTVLERHDNLDVIDMSHTTRRSDTTELSLKAGVMFDIPRPLQIGSYRFGSFKAGPVAELTFATGHETARRSDTGGHDRVETQQTAATAQRLTLQAGVSLPGASALLTKDLHRSAQRDTMTATTIGGRLDVEFEREALSPNQLLAELSTHREAWLARAMAHTPDVPVGPDGSTGQDLAGQQLDSFIRAVRKLADDKPGNGMFHRFVINQTLSDPARTAVEVLEARGRVATMRGDTAELAAIALERQRLLDEPSSRQPGALLVTAHSDESASKGLPVVLIAQRRFAAEAQHVVAQFPPATRAAG